MNKLRSQAERLRSEGYSYNLIHEKLRISKSTLSYWFKDKPYTPNQLTLHRTIAGPNKAAMLRHAKRLEQTSTLKTEGIKEIGKLSKRDLWLVGIGLYIGEGAKTIEAIRISNSNPAVIRLSLAWLRVACGFTSANFRLRLHAYSDNNIEDCLAYWQDVTGLSRANFRHSIIDVRTNKSAKNHNKLPYGTVHVSVVSNGDPEKGVRLFRKMTGWMDGVTNQL